MTNPSPSTRRNKTVNKSGLPMGIKVGALAVLVIILFAGMIFFNTSGEKEEQREKEIELSETDTIYNNIYINNVNVGSLTMQEASKKLTDNILDDFADKKVILNADGTAYEYNLTDFGAGYDIEAAVAAAYEYGRNGDLKDRAKIIDDLETEPYRIEAMYTYNAEKVNEVVENLYEMTYVEPINATLERRNGAFITTDEVDGKALDTTDAIDKIIALLEEGTGGSADLFIETVEAEYTAESFKNATSLIGTWTTTFSAGDNGRNTNIKTAASKINDFVLYPGEVFSTNKEFGVMTYDNGYRMAPVIIGGELKDDMGGGVCQVSSTLYMALLYSELEIVERQNHSQKVGYMDYGFDATLAGDYIDLKFRNDTDYPVYIESVIGSSSLTVNIYGYEIHSPTRKLEFYSELVETVPAPEENVIEDPDLPLDERVVTTSALNGRRYKVYKKVYENGALITTETVNTSYYRPRAAVVRVGTGAAVESVEEIDKNEPADIPETPVEAPEPSAAVSQEESVPQVDTTPETVPQPEPEVTPNTDDDTVDYNADDAPPIIED